jgi:hypothetical protein
MRGIAYENEFRTHYGSAGFTFLNNTMNTQNRKNAGISETPMSSRVTGGSASPGAIDRGKNRAIISNVRKCFIEVLHRNADPSTWIVRRWKNPVLRRSITMRYDYFYAKHRKRSSPPFRKSKRGFDDWVRSFHSVDQHPYDMSEIQAFQQQKKLKEQIALQEAGSEHRSVNKTEPQRVQDDQGRWQDDGGGTE